MEGGSERGIGTVFNPLFNQFTGSIAVTKALRGVHSPGVHNVNV